MQYLVDGYNVLFRVFKGGNKALQTERQELLEVIGGMACALKLNVIIVFDSYYVATDETYHNIAGLKVVFTKQGETADQYIISRLEAKLDKAKLTVVTSDKVLARHAKAHYVHTETAESFIAEIERRYLKQSIRPKIQKRPAAKAMLLEQPATVDVKVQRTVYGYYLEEFEKRIEQLALEQSLEAAKSEQVLHQNTERPLRRKAKPIAAMTDESEFERWLTIFEDKLKP